jgi:uncharacterized DUF497 family protein
MGNRDIRVEELVWDAKDYGNAWHIEAKHGVCVWQVESIIFECEAKIVGRDKARYPENVAVIGEDRGGTVLVIFLEPVDKEKGVWRCASARGAEQHEKEFWQKNKGRA